MLEHAKKDSDRSYSLPSLTPEKDKLKFDTLTRSLSYYLNEEQQRPINRDSVASQVLRAVIANGKFDVIYSFNYTDLHHIAKEIGITEKFNYEHVHGCLKDNSIILGVEDESDLMDGYSFLYKTFSPTMSRTTSNTIYLMQTKWYFSAIHWNRTITTTSDSSSATNAMRICPVRKVKR